MAPKIDYFPDFARRASGILGSLARSAERVDIAVTTFTLDHWLDVQVRLEAFTGRGGQLRALVWPGSVTVQALEGLRNLENTQVAVGRGAPPAQKQEFFFFTGKGLTVATSSVFATLPGLAVNGDCGAIVRQDDYPNDPAACEAIARFEDRWRDATRLDDDALAEFKAMAGGPSFQVGDLVRSTKDMYKQYGAGRVQLVRNGLAKIEFNPSVFMEPPYRSENKILPLDEIEKVDTPLDRAARGEWDPAWRFELKMLAARLLTGNKGGSFPTPGPRFCRTRSSPRTASSPVRGGASCWPTRWGWARPSKRA